MSVSQSLFMLSFRNRPRCETRAVFLFANWIWPFLGDFRGFWRPGGTSYYLCAESVLNRKFQENNLFWVKMRKIMYFFLEIKKIAVSLYPG